MLPPLYAVEGNGIWSAKPPATKVLSDTSVELFYSREGRILSAPQAPEQWMRITHDTIDVDISSNPFWDRDDATIDISAVNSDVGDQGLLGVD
jgi:hypothetical protein